MINIDLARPKNRLSSRNFLDATTAVRYTQAPNHRAIRRAPARAYDYLAHALISPEEATIMRKSTIGKTLGIATLAALASVLAGCAVTDPSPSMVARGRSDAEIAKTYTMMSETNIRQIIDDLERSLYIDRPSRLSPSPTPY